ncbi:MAG: coproporphyrinogen III oxidase, partial [Arenicellales bacterium]
MNTEQLNTVIAYLESLQDEVCRALQSADGVNAFREDRWEYAHGGGGRSRVMGGESGVFEQVGVNFSHVSGAALPESATARR